MSQSIKIFFSNFEKRATMLISVFHIRDEKTMHFKFNLGVHIDSFKEPTEKILPVLEL